MVDINQVYSGAWLKASDLLGRDHKLTIESADIHEFKNKDGTTKKQLVLSFVGKQKRLGLNITNASTIAKNLDSTESAAWIGKQITLYPTTDRLGHEMVDCIRVREVINQRQLREMAGRSIKDQTENPGDGLGDDEIPF